MKRSISRWTLAATAAALLAVPAPGAAQTSSPATPQTQSQSSTASPQVPDAAREHLTKAKAALADVQTTNLNANARTQVTELKKRMTALERAVGVRDSAPAAKTTNANWGTEVAAIDKALTALLGNASTTGATGTTTPPATGTSGSTASSAAGGMTVDEATRAKLTELRTHVTAFATAMAGGKTEASPEPSAATSTTGSTSSTAATAGTAGSTAGTAASGTAGTAASGTTGTAATTTQQPPAAEQTPQTTAAQADEDAARRHLTEARNTLSAMTQLPAAAQLQGDARTHVSQLISNFNELITTQTEWKATYTKLEANLTALLGPDPAGSTTTGTATGTAGATGTTGTTGTTGATAGTSGTAAVELDPALREKLVELRRHLNEFEKAAGGAPAAASTPASTPAASTTPMTSGTAGTAGTTAAATSGTAGTTGTTAGATSTTDPAAAQSGQTAQAGSQDLMKHVAAIDAMLRMQDDSGGLTLTKAQVEQLRTHWAALTAALTRR